LLLSLDGFRLLRVDELESGVEFENSDLSGDGSRGELKADHPSFCDAFGGVTGSIGLFMLDSFLPRAGCTKGLESSISANILFGLTCGLFENTSVIGPGAEFCKFSIFLAAALRNCGFRKDPPSDNGEELELGRVVSFSGVEGRALFSAPDATNGPAATLFSRLKRPPPQRPPRRVVVSATGSLGVESSIRGDCWDSVSIPRPLGWPRDQFEPGEVICVEGVIGVIERFSSL
jgi:hypothetical protein